MKILPNKKWSRRLVRTLVVALSIVVFAWVAIDWWGARARQQAQAKIRAAGMPTDVAALMAGMPPEEENFALIPLLKQAGEEAHREPNDDRLPAGSAMLRLREMWDDSFAKARSRPKSNGPWRIDFSQLPEGGPYGRSARSFLDEYERRNAGTLGELWDGLARTRVKQPLVFSPVDESIDWSGMTERLGLRLMNAARGLNLRAQAAIEVGEPAKAAESIELSLRLAEVIGSRGMLISALVEFASLASTKVPLARGLEAHRWSDAELQRIQRALAQADLRASTLRTFDVEYLRVLTWTTWRNDRALFARQAASMQTIESSWVSRCVSRMPAGWFDLNGAASVDRVLQLAALVRSPAPLVEWWRAADEVEREQARQGALVRALLPGSRDFGQVALLRRACFTMVLQKQAILACELERFRLAHGGYPDRLEAIDPGLTEDPLFGRPFGYRKDGESYVLYSIGPDGKDEGGVMPTNESQVLFRRDWVW